MKASSSAGTRRHAPALSFAATFGASAAAACVAEASTLPLDTAKVRLQLQTLSAGGSSIKYNGPIDVIRRMCAEEGWRSLYNGLTPGLHRQFLFTGAFAYYGLRSPFAPPTPPTLSCSAPPEPHPLTPKGFQGSALVFTTR